MKNLAVLLIRFYQKYISPHKGFRCAHAKFHGGDSCSEAVRKIVVNQGLFGGFGNIKKRFGECTLAYRKLVEQQDKRDDNEQNKKSNRCGCSYQNTKRDCLQCGGEACGELSIAASSIIELTFLSLTTLHILHGNQNRSGVCGKSA